MLTLNRRVFITGCVGFWIGDVRSMEPAIAPIADYERACRGRLGVFARNLRTGATLQWRADERFVMCSTFKASLAGLVLQRVDEGQDRLDASMAYGPADVPDWYAPVARQNLSRGELTIRELCDAAVTQSDNTCANLLLSRVGGPPALTEFWRSLGDQQSRLDQVEPYLNRTPEGMPENTTTPKAMAGSLEALVLGPRLSPGSRQLLTQWLLDCQTGFRRLRAGLPENWRIGDKTGNNGLDAAGDIAVAWPDPRSPIVICAYTRGGSPSQGDIEAVFSGIGHYVADHLA